MALRSPFSSARLHVTTFEGLDEVEELDMKATTNRKRGSRDRVRSYRERMRDRGLRPVQIWVPDTRGATFSAEAHRQSLVVAESARAQEDQGFIDAISGLGEG